MSRAAWFVLATAPFWLGGCVLPASLAHRAPPTLERETAGADLRPAREGVAPPPQGPVRLASECANVMEISNRRICVDTQSPEAAPTVGPGGEADLSAHGAPVSAVVAMVTEEGPSQEGAGPQDQGAVNPQAPTAQAAVAGPDLFLVIGTYAAREQAATAAGTVADLHPVLLPMRRDGQIQYRLLVDPAHPLLAGASTERLRARGIVDVWRLKLCADDDPEPDCGGALSQLEDPANPGVAALFVSREGPAPVRGPIPARVT